MFESTVVLLMAFVAVVLGTASGALFGLRTAKKHKQIKDSVITMVETRQQLLSAINRELAKANWWTKRRIRKELLKKGLVVDCSNE